MEGVEINKIDLKMRLLTRHTKQIISAPYYFFGVNIGSSLHILGQYNNQDLAGLASFGLSGRKVVKGLLILLLQVFSEYATDIEQLSCSNLVIFFLLF